MNTTDKIVLKQISENLKSSTNKNWVGGDVDDWCDYAKKMRAIIESSTAIIDKLLGDTTETETEQ